MKIFTLNRCGIVAALCWLLPGSLVVNAQETEVVNIENQAVSIYMDDLAYYTDTDYDHSVVEQYYDPSLHDTRLDTPRGKKIAWTPVARSTDIAEVRVSLSELPNYDNAAVYKISASSVTHVARNMCPGTTYYYKVEEVLKAGTTNVVASGSFVTEGQVRMIYVSSVHNVRDLGGWPTSFGVPVKYGKLFRSGKLDNITSPGIQTLGGNMKVGAELDLRTYDVTITASPLGDDVDYINIPGGQYHLDLESKGTSAATGLRWIIDRMRDGKVVDFHCELGCDRAGTMAFLIEGLLGVGEVDLCRDYELSTFSAQTRTRAFGRVNHGTFAGMLPYIRTFGPDNDLARCFYNYWLSVGMTSTELDELRFMMLGVEAGVEVKECQREPSVYDIMGNKLSRLSQGLNIIVHADGSVSKQLVR